MNMENAPAKRWPASMDHDLSRVNPKGDGERDRPTQSELLAAFAVEVQIDSVPAEVLALAKGHFLDVLGIAIASSGFDFGFSILAGARELGEGGPARALGSGISLPVASAAMVNGTLGHGLDFDDTHISAVYHASAPAFATALAVAEDKGKSGQEVLMAYIVALEIGCRLAAGAKGEFHDRGFHPTGTAGTFAAAAAAARLAGDSHANLVSALGLCGSQAAGILELRESWLKRLHPGWAAHAGIAAAALARHGFRGPATVLDGPQGFYAAHVGRIPSGEEAPAYRLGETWHTLGLALKPYPCCHFVHAFIDAALALRGGISLDQVERIDAPLTLRLHGIVAEPRERRVRPPTVYDALFSVPYAVGLALVHGRVDLATFYDEPLDNPAVLRIAALTSCGEDPISDYPAHFPGELRITLKSGTVLTRREATSLGTPERRLSKAHIQDKFIRNATRVLPEPQAQLIADVVWQIEQLEDVRELVSMCIARKGH